MDPFFLPSIIDQAMPAVVVFIVFGTPLAFTYLMRSFRLREKELDLRRALAERPRDEEIMALEERVERLERDRAFFERLADRSLRNQDAAAFGPRARVSEPIEALMTVDAAPELEAVRRHAPRDDVYAR
jgi:hypothetical protein